MLPHRLLEQLLQQAAARCLPEANPSELLVRPCPDPRFGDYQSSALIAWAKARKMNPRVLASDVAARMDLPEWASVEVAGAGFLNFRLKPAIIGRVLSSAIRGDHLFFDAAVQPRTVVVDFSSPNVAKPMHVGHIRSTILGDCLARTLRLLGHSVITDNHIGDWGTQFGKLIVGWKRHRNEAALNADPLAEMERLYQRVNRACEEDSTVLEAARSELVKLQNGDTENRALWQRMIALSQSQFDLLYQRLGVRFDYVLGESFYNSRLKSIVRQLEQAGLARESDGAIAVFFDDIPELKEHPALVQKSDGAANYTTTDLATLQYRMETWHPDEIIYVTDGRQQLHFKQIFSIFRRWQSSARIKLVHVWFGAILGGDGTPFKTRSGDVIRLSDLLDEAESKAFLVVSEKNPDLNESERREIARAVGIGAIKYADLLPNRQSDYVFNWDKMLALNGNTAPYLLYAYARIRSIFRKLDKTGAPLESVPNTHAGSLVFVDEDEIRLAKQLLKFGLVLEAVVEEYRPNYLCNYLYELAGLFARFYENCPVLKSEGFERASRLTLCDLTSQVLRKGLEVLGIETPEKM